MNTICPWCQTEIVWDEELGPEEECPHCQNDLEGFRTIQIPIDTTNDSLDEEDFKKPHAAIESVLDEQLEAIECTNCRGLMILVGHSIQHEAFVPRVSDYLEKPLLDSPIQTDMYVCPECFQVTSKLGEKARLAMIKQLGGKVQ